LLKKKPEGFIQYTVSINLLTRSLAWQQQRLSRFKGYLQFCTLSRKLTSFRQSENVIVL